MEPETITLVTQLADVGVAGALLAVVYLQQQQQKEILRLHAQIMTDLTDVMRERLRQKGTSGD